MKGKRYPGKLRADGLVKGLQLARRWEPIINWPAPVRPYQSAQRTRSSAWRAGSRRTKKDAR